MFNNAELDMQRIKVLWLLPVHRVRYSFEFQVVFYNR